VMAYIFDVAHLMTDKLVSMVTMFANLKSNSGLPIDLKIAFVIAIVIILLVTYPLYLAISALHSVNYQIRQMLMYVPHQVIDSLPRLKYYIETNKLMFDASTYSSKNSINKKCSLLSLLSKICCCSCRFLSICINSGGDLKISLVNSIDCCCTTSSFGESLFAGENTGNSGASILEASNDSVIVCSMVTDSGSSDQQITVMEVNKTLTEVFGYNTEDITGLSLWKLVPEQEQTEFKSIVRDVLVTGKAIKLENQNFVRKSGAVFPAFVSLGVCYYAANSSKDQQQQQAKSKVLVLFVRDITIERKQKELLHMEQERAEKLLLNILPQRIASRLKNGEMEIAETNEDVTVLFTDMVGFTHMSKTITASKLVELLNAIVQQFDALAIEYKLEKIKTIGDAYFCCGGLDQQDNVKDTTHPERIIHCALAMIETIKQFNLQIRAGCHTGPVVSGVIGKLKFQYDVYGDTVNTASRMESTGVPGRIQCSRETYARVFDMFDFEERSGVHVKGKGTMTTYMVQKVKESNASGTKMKTQ